MRYTAASIIMRTEYAIKQNKHPAQGTYLARGGALLLSGERASTGASGVRALGLARPLLLPQASLGHGVGALRRGLRLDTELHHLKLGKKQTYKVFVNT